MDGSGEIDENEFHNLLVHLKASPEHIHPDSQNMRREIMKDLKAVKRHHTRFRSKHKLVVLRPHFVELVASGKLGAAMRDDWVCWAERQRIRENFLSDMLLVLFLLHAPLSQRGFYFFDCTQIGTRAFLRQDFSLECFTEKHQQMVPVALSFLIFFSFLFPLTVLLQLCRHRKGLHTPEIRHRFGFLYASFNVGAEYWEIHEVFRKMILTGLLVFIPGNTRAAVAILVSVMSVATLNYFKPHSNPLVFFVAEGSFIITTFKYLSVILLSITNDADKTTTNYTSDVVGTLLVVLDMVFMLASVGAMVAVMVVLRNVLVADKNDTKVVPGQENNELLLVSRWSSFDHVRALQHAKVEETEQETQRAHDAAIKVIEMQQASAHVRIMNRVQRRKSTNASRAKKRLPAPPTAPKAKQREEGSGVEMVQSVPQVPGKIHVDVEQKGAEEL